MTNRRTFLKQASFSAIGMGVLVVFPDCKNQSTPSEKTLQPFTRLPRNTPESQGISSAVIQNFLAAVEQSDQEFHGFMLLKNGQVISECWWSPFSSAYKHTLYSLSKSFTSTAVGMVVEEGKLSVEDSIISFFEEDIPAEVSDNLAAMKVKHLLTMNTGHGNDPTRIMQQTADGNWAKSFLAQPVVHAPGSHFLYSTGATYMLSAIIQKLTGQTVFDYLSEKLFKPLNIENADWETDPRGITVGGYGLRTRLADIAKLGQLYLQNGSWEGEQLIPAEWVAEATKKQTNSQDNDSDWGQGYGYKFWRCKPEPGFYRGDGAFGQYCIVIPQMDVVIAINSESSDMGASMNLVWEHLLPALSANEALPTNEKAHQSLLNFQKNLHLPVLSLNEKSPIISEISAKKFDLHENEKGANSIMFSFENNKCIVSIQNGETTQNLTCGIGKWIVENNEWDDESYLSFVPNRLAVKSKVAGSATWQDDQTLLLNLKFIENIHGDQWTCRFDKNTVEIAFMGSVSKLRNQEDARETWKGKFE